MFVIVGRIRHPLTLIRSVGIADLVQQIWDCDEQRVDAVGFNSGAHRCDGEPRLPRTEWPPEQHRPTCRLATTCGVAAESFNCRLGCDAYRVALETRFTVAWRNPGRAEVAIEPSAPHATPIGITDLVVFGLGRLPFRTRAVVRPNRDSAAIAIRDESLASGADAETPTAVRTERMQPVTLISQIKKSVEMLDRLLCSGAPYLQLLAGLAAEMPLMITQPFLGRNQREERLIDAVNVGLCRCMCRDEISRRAQ